MELQGHVVLDIKPVRAWAGQAFFQNEKAVRVSPHPEIFGSWEADMVRAAHGPGRSPNRTFGHGETPPKQSFCRRGIDFFLQNLLKTGGGRWRDIHADA